MKKLTIITAILITSNLLFAQIINIPDDYPTIQQGIDAANDGDTVLVYPGVYLENCWLILSKGITLASLTLVTGDTSYISQTIIDGNHNGNVILALGTPDSGNTIIEGFTIKNGDGDGFGWGGGGGICVIDNSLGSSLIFRNTIIKENSSIRGGGLYCYNTEVSEGEIIFQNVAVMNNTSSENGGGIYCENVSPAFYSVKIDGNNCENWHLGGGAFFLNSNPRLIDVIFTSNFAYEGGGAYFLNSNPLLQNVKVSSNIVSGYKGWELGEGGGMYFENSNPTFQNGVITENMPDGLYCRNSVLVVKNTTIANNSFDGIDCRSTQLSIVNSIIWGNEYQILIHEGSQITASYNDIQHGINGISSGNNDTINWLEGNIDEDPLFEGSGDHPFQLTAGSPCIDAGTPDTTGLNLPNTDILGNIRLWDGDGNGSVIVDMGAYEFGAITGFLSVVQSSEFEVRSYPNPVSTKNTIEFDLAKPTMVSIQIYSNLGEKVQEVGNRVFPRGLNQVTWNAANLPAGIYFCQIQIGNDMVTKKIIKVK